MTMPDAGRQLLLAAALLGGQAMAAAAGPLPQVDVGRIERLVAFPSRHVAARDVDVWVHPGCHDGRRCAVVYMHDGQNLFDERITWNRQSWRVSQAVDTLVQAGRIEPLIVVGVHSVGPLRYRDYFPSSWLDALPPERRAAFESGELKGKPQGDDYLRFLADELKPAIDAAFPTRPGREDTCTIGASMGALISVYAFERRPDVFGCAGGFSTHFALKGQPNAELPLSAFIHLQRKLPLADGTRRLYMEHGTEGLDKDYAPFQRFVDRIVRDKGYGDAVFRSLVFPGDGHDEASWAKHLPDALAFLFGPKGATR